MSDRFVDLKKIPNQPALRLLAVANAKLDTETAAPANASVPEVMEELEASNAVVDMLKLVAVSLPVRECVWWACLAARDIVGTDAKPPRPLEIAEAWVRKPEAALRNAARDAAQNAEPDDDTALCAVCVAFHDGKLGDGEFARHNAPPGASSIAALGMNLLALSHHDGDFLDTANALVDRGLDIARGGNGRIELPAGGA